MMSKKRGKIVHKSIGLDGGVKIIDVDMTRYLYLGSDAVQSAMSLSDPVALSLSYTRAMMSFLLFSEAPRTSLVLGLGGGSLVRFLRHHFPTCKIDAVEQRPDIVRLAKAYFQIRPGPELSIHVADAGEFLNHPNARASEGYDVIFVDTYDNAGLSDSVLGYAFFTHCRRLLSNRGTIVVNLWGSQRGSYETALHHLSDNFMDQVLCLPVLSKGNVIALGTTTAVATRQLKRLKPKARELQTRYDLEFPRFARDLQKYNRHRWLTSLIKRF